jgi:hypothetical protein
MRGERAMLLHELVPTAGEAVAVRVLAGGTWRLAGVLGGDAAVTVLARTLAQRGAEGVAARMLAAADGAPCEVRWVAAPRAPTPTPKRADVTPRATTSRVTKSSRGTKTSTRTTAARTTTTRTTATRSRSRTHAS